MPGWAHQARQVPCKAMSLIPPTTTWDILLQGRCAQSTQLSTATLHCGRAGRLSTWVFREKGPGGTVGSSGGLLLSP